MAAAKLDHLAGEFLPSGTLISVLRIPSKPVDGGASTGLEGNASGAFGSLALHPTLLRLLADALIRTAASDYYQGLRCSSVDIQHI
jgi:hypothetical protein